MIANAEQTSCQSDPDRAVGHSSGSADTGEPFTLSGDEPKSVDSVDPVPAKAARKYTRRLGKIVVEGRPVKVWVDGQTICFRHDRKRKVERISLINAYYGAVGQLELSLHGHSCKS